MKKEIRKLFKDTGYASFTEYNSIIFVYFESPSRKNFIVSLFFEKPNLLKLSLEKTGIGIEATYILNQIVRNTDDIVYLLHHNHFFKEQFGEVFKKPALAI